jgi:hypothetical protein
LMYVSPEYSPLERYLFPENMFYALDTLKNNKILKSKRDISYLLILPLFVHQSLRMGDDHFVDT